MPPLLKFFKSTVGLKVVMGVTGLLLAAFVLVHMLGNLQVFLGENAINAYGALLHASHEVLWGFRIGLLVVVVLHIASAIELAKRNRAARPRGYDVTNPNKASFASRYMMVSGLIVLAFIIFHILHFTTWTIFPEYADMIQHGEPYGERHNIFEMMVSGFSIPWVVGIYVVGMALVSIHLSHGVASLFRSIGLMNNIWRPVEERLSMIYAIVIFCGMTIIPLAILAGFGRAEAENVSVAQVETQHPEEQADGTGR